MKSPLDLDDYHNIADAFFAQAKSWPDRTVYAQPDRSGRWTDASYAAVVRRVQSIANFLRSLALKTGERIAIISNSRPEWIEADIAILSLGGVTVSVYQSLVAKDLGYILFDSGATVVFAENLEQFEKLIALETMAVPIPATEERPAEETRIALRQIVSFEQISAEQRQRSSVPLTTLSEILAQAPAAPDDKPILGGRGTLASLVYTSGTSGPPKGVIQTHGNHLANVRQAFQAGIYREDSSIVLVLPLAHSFAKLMGYIGFLTNAVIKFPAIASAESSRPDPKIVSRDLVSADVSLIPLVPRLLEKMQEGIEARASRRGLGAALLRLTLWSARKVRGSEHKAELLPRAIFRLTSGIRRKIKRALFGRRFEYVISGGAKLSVDTARFFDMLEIEVLEGYGLTETCVATNVNRKGSKRIGTVGPVLAPDIEVRIAEDGEILFRGPNVAQGYYRREQATRAAWSSDGWFRTGDLGSLSQDGFLSVTGRKKELIVTAGGKKIAPELIEQRLKGFELISQAVLIGEGRPYCVALLTLNSEAARRILEEQAPGQCNTADAQSLALNETVQARVRQDVEKLNRELASFESIKKIAIIGEEFTVENGLLTPTLKVKRHEVNKRFDDQIQALYESGVSAER